MLTPIRHGDLGRFSNEWLNARYHFSFSEYHNSARMGFGPLRVINDDRIRAGSGFGMHPHRDMEIITYVRSGAIIHRDSLGNEGRTDAGDVQVMSAGSGIRHAESSDAHTDTTLFQIWIQPRERGVTPRWDQRAFPKDPVADALPLLVSGRAEDADKGALAIHQDAAIYGGRMVSGAQLVHALQGPAYIIMSAGTATINGTLLGPGDGAEVTNEPRLDIHAVSDAELLVIDLPEL